MYLAKVIVFSVITSIVLGQGNDLENRLQLLEKKNAVLEAKIAALEIKFETSKLSLTDGLASVENVVDELKMVTNVLRVEESCAALGKLGYTQTGTYPIDPDGKSQNLPPVQAHCSLPDGKTSIGKNKFEILRIYFL